MLYRCYAKINLTLEVRERRPDGFHRLASLVHTISLADALRIEPADEILSRVVGIEALDDNLVTRAAYLLASTTHTRQGAELTLVKRIPTAAGLGGGSSDAAATLVGLNKLWDTGLGLNAITQLAAQLGSDVPFFMRGGAALMRGRGDELEPLPPIARQWLVVAVPTHNTVVDKTARLYGALRPEDFSDGAVTDAAAARVRSGASLAGAQLVNVFARAATEEFPGLSTLRTQLEESCARPFHLSGAGPALFAFAASRQEAHELAHRAATPQIQTFAVRTVRGARASITGRTIGYA
ncbi:MAG TPA: 4-(cytidine 5'-diphospho)-2-C-methyl-D-erythritol kinase [Chloroflexota bacterium]|jgi:4-diphosphocytidyl-2-C-methyl-D-erythritol kinase|nr:4-(cytidine 5'-diphospho)-2-C-methyl-D-erythritol kinase [Chloroflexota bacterium]